jgi:16S rRNA processing protein RimM
VVRPHGIRGEVAVEVRTDDPGQRFAAGSVLSTDPPAAGPLTVVSTRWHSGRLLVSFAGITGRNEAEPLRGVWLTVNAAQVTAPEDPDEFLDHELVGLTVVTTAGERVGVVTDVRHHGQDLLVIEPAADSHRRGEVLVPFVAAIAVDVDVTGGRMVIDPPAGLLDLASAGPAGPGGSPPREQAVAGEQGAPREQGAPGEQGPRGQDAPRAQVSSRGRVASRGQGPSLGQGTSRGQGASRRQGGGRAGSSAHRSRGKG